MPDIGEGRGTNAWSITADARIGSCKDGLRSWPAAVDPDVAHEPTTRRQQFSHRGRGGRNVEPPSPRPWSRPG
jgi:hypothetical protein